MPGYSHTYGQDVFTVIKKMQEVLIENVLNVLMSSQVYLDSKSQFCLKKEQQNRACPQNRPTDQPIKD